MLRSINERKQVGGGMLRRAGVISASLLKASELHVREVATPAAS